MIDPPPRNPNDSDFKNSGADPPLKPIETYAIEPRAPGRGTYPETAPTGSTHNVLTMDSLEPVVILLSGGLNSVAAATHALPGADAHFVYFNHGHPAAKAELQAVRRLSEALAARLHIVKLPSIADIVSTGDGRGPNRRSRDADHAAFHTVPRAPGVLLTMLGGALQLAAQLKAGTIVCGVSQAGNEAESNAERGHGDPESRHIFFHAAATAMKTALPPKRRIEIETPFVDMERADVVRAGMRLGAPFHLSWSCHHSGPEPCGRCPGCTARAAAFDEVGLADPMLLQTP